MSKLKIFMSTAMLTVIVGLKLLDIVILYMIKR